MKRVGYLYVQVNNSQGNENEVFWDQLEECLGGFRPSDKVCLLGDLNARVGDEQVGNVVGPF